MASSSGSAAAAEDFFDELFSRAMQLGLLNEAQLDAIKDVVARGDRTEKNVLANQYQAQQTHC